MGITYNNARTRRAISYVAARSLSSNSEADRRRALCQLNTTIPYYKEMISMIPVGHSRPNIPEYPQIAENIKQAIDEVYLGVKEPKQALDDAARNSAKMLGW